MSHGNSLFVHFRGIREKTIADNSKGRYECGFNGFFDNTSSDFVKSFLFGLDNAGKTTLLYQTAHGEAPTTIPTNMKATVRI